MATITATLVNELRAKTGQGMMECKKMLTETDGDVSKAIDAFRKKGVKSSITERSTSEGRAYAVAEGNTAVGVVVNCNTDFTAKSDPIQTALEQAARKLLKAPILNLAEDEEVRATMAAVSQQTGENVHLGRTAAVAAPDGGGVGAYTYGITGKIAVLLQFAGGKPTDDLVKQIGGHIAFAKPVGLTRDEVPADLVAKEREIAVEQAKATGKPQQIAEKIAEGKLNSFFAERVLLDQEFFNAAVFKGTIANYLKQNALTLEKYVRLEVGQA